MIGCIYTRFRSHLIICFNAFRRCRVKLLGDGVTLTDGHCITTTHTHPDARHNQARGTGEGAAAPRRPTGMSGPNEQNPLVEMCVRTSGEVYKLWLLFIDHRNGKKVENREESMECETGARVLNPIERWSRCRCCSSCCTHAPRERKCTTIRFRGVPIGLEGR